VQPWLTRNVKLLSAVSLAQDAASELLYPIMPIVLTTMLGAPPAIVGAIEGIAEGAAALLKYLSGRLSDRFGRKPAIVAGYGLAAIGKLLVAAAVVWPVVLVGRVVDRVGKGMRGAPRDALLTVDVRHEHLGRVFGFHRAADNLGAVVGPALGLGVLAVTDGNLSAALWIAVIPAALSVVLTLWVREAPAPARTADPADDIAAAHPLPTGVRSLAALLGIIALVNFPDAMLLLRLHEIGYSAQAVLLMYMLFNFAMTLIAFPAGMLADRLPKSRVYAIGLLCFAVGYLGLGLLDGGPFVVLAFFVYGGFVGITDGVGKAWISTLAPQALRGHAQGLLQGLSGGAVLVAGIWAGLAWNLGQGDGRVPLVFSGTVTAIAALALLIVGRRWDAPKSQSRHLGSGA
jgi:MFS family permease